MVTQLQQGDVNIVGTTEKPKDIERIEGGTIREGTASGHSHRIVGTAFKLYNVIGMAGALFAEVESADCSIVHEEHREIKLPIGDYLFMPTVEFDHFTDRSGYVLD